MKIFIIGVVLFSFSGVANAEEILTEKAQVTVNNVTRSGKKVLHRTAEAVCGTLTGDNKVQCLAKKAKNRIEEGVDAVKDKGTELKDSVK